MKSSSPFREFQLSLLPLSIAYILFHLIKSFFFIFQTLFNCISYVFLFTTVPFMRKFMSFSYTIIVGVIYHQHHNLSFDYRSKKSCYKINFILFEPNDAPLKVELSISVIFVFKV